MIMKFKEDMIKTFEITSLGSMCYFFGLYVSKRNDKIFISQNKFKMYYCKHLVTPLVANEILVKKDGAPEANTSRY